MRRRAELLSLSIFRLPVAGLPVLEASLLENEWRKRLFPEPVFEVIIRREICSRRSLRNITLLNFPLLTVH